jgi:uncharacterized protein (UPF0332 family)
MALHEDLLSQARWLATAEAGNLLSINLRRAISSAYYAVFHLLVAESVALLIPKSPSGLTARVSRSYGHAEMNKVCGAFAK